MRKSALILAAVALAAAGAVPVAATTAATDDWCQFTATEDPTAEPGTLSGELSGGPAAVPGASPLGAGTLTCRIQVNGSNHSAPGPQVQGHGTVLVSAGPSQVSFVANPWDNVYLCDEFTDDATGTTYYWDATFRVWATQSDVDCEIAIPASEAEPTPAQPTKPVDESADCPYGNVTGDVTYNTAVTASTGHVTWTMTLHADCVGNGGVQTHYDLTLTGASDESCTDGTGGATVTGTGPNGTVSGTWSFTRGGIHYYGYEPRGHGHFTDSAGEHQMAWWLDIKTRNAEACPISLVADVVGHGAITM